MIATTTRLEVRGLRGWVRFFRHIVRVRKQLDRPPGLVHMELRGLRTLTVWNDRRSMQKFRNSGAHRNAMIAWPGIGRATSVTWEVDGVPSWEDALARYAETYAPKPGAAS
jgi:hypothetical protein